MQSAKCYKRIVAMILLLAGCIKLQTTTVFAASGPFSMPDSKPVYIDVTNSSPDSSPNAAPETVIAKGGTSDFPYKHSVQFTFEVYGADLLYYEFLYKLNDQPWVNFTRDPMLSGWLSNWGVDIKRSVYANIAYGVLVSAKPQTAVNGDTLTFGYLCDESYPDGFIVSKADIYVDNVLVVHQVNLQGAAFQTYSYTIPYSRTQLLADHDKLLATSREDDAAANSKIIKDVLDAQQQAKNWATGQQLNRLQADLDKYQKEEDLLDYINRYTTRTPSQETQLEIVMGNTHAALEATKREIDALK